MPAASHSGHSRRWIGFFLVLAGLAAVAIIVPLFYNLSIQLRPGQLVEARRRWQENAPLNYDLEYLIRTTHSGQDEERAYLVQVRGGQVVLVVCNSEVVYLDPSLALIAGLGVSVLSSEDPKQFGVPALFDEIEAALLRNELSGRRNFATAQFDSKDGHPFHYVHRVRGAKERVEWNIKMTRFSPTILPP
jgi:hypothetical protein